MSMHRRAFLLLIAASAGACADGRLGTPLPVRALDGPYRLDAGDKLRITVFDQPALTNVYTVDQAGSVAFPLIGNVVARGRTTKELTASIARGLNGGYLRNADVSVEIDTYRPFFIMGEVRNPGQYTYVAGLTAETAVAIAGGFTVRAVEGRISVSRVVDGKVVAGILPPTAPVQPGDVLKIDRRMF